MNNSSQNQTTTLSTSEKYGHETLEHTGWAQKIKGIQASQKTQFQLEVENQSLQNFVGSQLASNTPTSLKAKQAYRDMIQTPKQETILHAYQIMSQPVVTVHPTLDIVSA